MDISNSNVCMSTQVFLFDLPVYQKISENTNYGTNSKKYQMSVIRCASTLFPLHNSTQLHIRHW